MTGPYPCKWCNTPIYFETIDGNTKPFEDQYGTIHICPGFKRISINPKDYFTYENLLRGIISNQQMIKEKLDRILDSIDK